RTAATPAGDRLHERALARGFGAPRRGVPPRAAGRRLHRGPERRDRAALGARRLRAAAADRRRAGEPWRGGDCRRRPRAVGDRAPSPPSPPPPPTHTAFRLGGAPSPAALVESFNRPGGNATGATLLSPFMEPKRLGLLRELAPGIAVFGALLNPRFPVSARQLPQLEAAARSIGQRLVVAKAGHAAERD